MYKVHSKLVSAYLCRQLPIRLNFLRQSHYETLQVKPSCTDQEIRDSFVKLSKECHPDTSQDKEKLTTDKFQNILEAYRVLSKPEMRASYDRALMSSEYHQIDKETLYREPWRAYASANPGHYYGIRGMKKISNWKIVIALAAFAMFGVLMQVVAIRSSFTLDRNRLDEISKNAGAQHANVRADAVKYGNEKQIERVTEKMLKNRYY